MNLVGDQSKQYPVTIKGKRGGLNGHRVVVFSYPGNQRRSLVLPSLSGLTPLPD